MNKAFLKSRIVAQIFSVSNNVSHLVQGTFLHQNIEMFLKSEVKATLGTFLDFCLFPAIICKQRKLHENEVTRSFRNQN